MSLWNDASGNWYAKEDALRRRQDCRRARPATLHHLVGHHRQWSIEGFHSPLCDCQYTPSIVAKKMDDRLMANHTYQQIRSYCLQVRTSSGQTACMWHVDRLIIAHEEN